ncbi:hypothetical protein PG985_008065 [Apiospora marii]|uniref:uncharacterized protein n=1 Tax=Apiospora marii TaxID=335849 RepID=UPI00312F32AB
MQFFGSVAILSLLAATSQAVPTNEPPLAPRIPRGQPDGSYVIHNQGTPNELHERLPDVPESSDLESASRHTEISPRADALFKRTDPRYVACGCVNLNHADCDGATHSLEAQVGRGTPVYTGGCLYSIKGSVVAFDCLYYNPGKGYSLSDERGLRATWGSITSDCGRYKAGTKGVRGQYGTGYMTSDHSNYFGDAWGSWKTSC